MLQYPTSPSHYYSTRFKNISERSFKAKAHLSKNFKIVAKEDGKKRQMRLLHKKVNQIIQRKSKRDPVLKTDTDHGKFMN
jgi:hypothetical protein